MAGCVASLAGTLLAVALLTAPAVAQKRGSVLVRADSPAAMAALPEGGLVYGELASGRIFEVSADGRRSARPIARVKVSWRGLKGLLGLAVAPDRRVFAAFTSRRNRSIVAQVAPGPLRVVWDGGRAAAEANGLRLAFAPDGALIVTVGDRLRSVRVRRRRLILPPFGHYAGRVLRLDPAGPASQRPQTLSRGWFNPYGLAITPSGTVWVADNAIEGPEALARGDRGRPRPGSFTRLRGVAPAGLVALDDRRLVLCGFASGRLQLYRIGDDGRARTSGTITRRCSVGVVLLADGRLAYATERAIRVIAPPPA
jgi:hypothetical protein